MLGTQLSREGPVPGFNMQTERRCSARSTPLPTLQGLAGAERCRPPSDQPHLPLTEGQKVASDREVTSLENSIHHTKAQAHSQ